MLQQAQVAQGNTSRSTERPNCWLWAKHRPNLVPLPDWAWGRLPKLAGSVLEYLCRHQQRQLWFDYAAASRTLAASPRRLQRTLRALRDLELVDVSVRVRRLQALDPGQGAWIEGFGSQVWVRPRASVMRRMDRTFAAYVPEGLIEMVAKRGTHGGARPGSGPKPGKKNNSSWRLAGGASAAKCADPGSEGAEGSYSSRRPLSTLSSGSSESLKTFPEERGPVVPLPAASSFLEPEEQEGGFNPDLIDLASQHPDRLLPTPEGSRGPRPSIPAWDKVPMSFEGWNTHVPELPQKFDLDKQEAASPGWTDKLQVARVWSVIRGYNLAARRIYGPEVQPLFARGSTDVTKSKLYPALLQAADALCAGDIAPAGWAAWRLQYAKDNGEAKAPGITRIMQPKTIHKLRGFFRREYTGGPAQTLLIERWHLEQMYRDREAGKRWAYGNRDVLRIMSAPKWYAEMRRAEMRAGIHDPLECWPTKDRHSKAAVPRPVKR